MKQKIFEALKAKFTGVNANVLNRIAEKLAKTVTTDEQVTTAVAGVTQELIEVIESYGDSRATEAQQTAVTNYESKYGLKEGKPVPSPDGGATAPTTTPPAGGAAETVPAWAQQLIESNKSLSERLNKMDGERTTATRNFRRCIRNCPKTSASLMSVSPLMRFLTSNLLRSSARLQQRWTDLFLTSIPKGLYSVDLPHTTAVGIIKGTR